MIKGGCLCGSVRFEIAKACVSAGFTDSHYFREQGVVAYGWSPIVSDADDGPAHGINERLSVEAIRNAPRVLYEAVRLVSERR